MYISSESHQKYVEKTTYNSKQARGLIFEAERMMSPGQLSPLGYVGTLYSVLYPMIHYIIEARSSFPLYIVQSQTKYVVHKIFPSEKQKFPIEPHVACSLKETRPLETIHYIKKRKKKAKSPNSKES